MKFSRYTLHTLMCSGDNEIRTRDPLLARQVLSQLSYTPVWFVSNIYSSTTKFAYRSLRASTCLRLSSHFAFRLVFAKFSGDGLKWTRTIDLTLIRRAL